MLTVEAVSQELREGLRGLDAVSARGESRGEV